MVRHPLLKKPTVAKGLVKYSKRVHERLNALASLLSAIEHFKKQIMEGYRARVEGELRDDETIPDQVVGLELVGRMAKTAGDNLTESEDVYRNQVIDRRSIDRASKDVARKTLYPELVQVRKEIETRFGRDAGRRFHGIEGATRRKPNRIEPQATTLVRRLKKWDLPEALHPGPDDERARWLERLEPGVKKLTDLLEELRSSELLEMMRRRERDFEIESFDIDFADALGYVRSTGRLAGFDDKWIWNLLSEGERRRLKGKARQEGEARAEGRRSRPKDI